MSNTTESMPTSYQWLSLVGSMIVGVAITISFMFSTFITKAEFMIQTNFMQRELDSIHIQLKQINDKMDRYYTRDKNGS